MPAAPLLYRQHLHRADQLHPGEPAPVVVVHVHAQRRLGPAAQVTHAGGFTRALGLVVDHAPHRVLGERVGDRQNARTLGVIHEGQAGHPARVEQVGGPGW